MRNPRYWLKLSGFFVLVLSGALAGLPFLLGSLLMVGLLYAPCQPGELSPADAGSDWEDVTVPARAGGNFRGYFFPGTNGATVIIPPTGADSRNNRLREASVLVQHGYAVFLFESRRCAGMGPLSLGYQEVNEVADALAYLLTRREVDSERIGVLGFSTAGATSIMAAARLPQLQAVVALGGYGDLVENGFGTGHRSGLIGYFERAFYRSAKITYRLITGDDIKVLSPVGVIDQIAPRPILLIYGDQERSLPGARQQLAAAGTNARLWVVPGAGHGNYLAVAGAEYEDRVTGFFDEALSNEE
jgi:dipeptidyl aminopeptidase/acylaminoacyl peptidase